MAREPLRRITRTAPEKETDMEKFMRRFTTTLRRALTHVEMNDPAEWILDRSDARFSPTDELLWRLLASGEVSEQADPIASLRKLIVPWRAAVGDMFIHDLLNGEADADLTLSERRGGWVGSARNHGKGDCYCGDDGECDCPYCCDDGLDANDPVFSRTCIRAAFVLWVDGQIDRQLSTSKRFPCLAEALDAAEQGVPA